MSDDQTTRTRIEEIIWCEGQADQLVADAKHDANELRWTAARLITEELDAGRTQREVAAAIGKSASHVNFMTQVHRVYQGKHDGQTFDACYQEVKKQPREEVAPRVETDQYDREFSDIEVVNAFRQYVKYIFTPSRAGAMTALGKKQMIRELEKAIELLKEGQE